MCQWLPIFSALGVVSEWLDRNTTVTVEDEAWTNGLEPPKKDMLTEENWLSQWLGLLVLKNTNVSPVLYRAGGPLATQGSIIIYLASQSLGCKRMDQTIVIWLPATNVIQLPPPSPVPCFWVPPGFFWLSFIFFKVVLPLGRAYRDSSWPDHFFVIIN